MNIKEKFLKATEKWYKYVKQDHYKDNDCHWYIGKRYSYGGDSNNWVAWHEGYITDFIELADSEEEAMQKTIEFINNFIEDERPPKW